MDINMENTDKQIEDFIKEISPKTGGIDELATLKIKHFIHKMMTESYIEGVNYCMNNLYNN